MIHILYIHGLNSSGNSRTSKCLEEYLGPGYKVFHPTFPEDADAALTKAKNELIKNKIDIVVASSLGGFIALKLRNVMKIVINPCMSPTVELPKLGVDEKTVSRYTQYEKSLLQGIDAEEREITFGVFGTHDELFSYRDLFKKYYNNFKMITDGHRISPSNIKNVIVPLIQHIIKDVRPELAKKLDGVVALHESLSIPDIEHIVISRNELNERFVNAFNVDEMKEYADQVWKILQDSYKYCGGLLGMRDVNQLIEESDMWKMVKRNGKINCVVIYSFKRGGRKLCYGGTDGTPQGKADFYKIMQEDINLKDRKAWAEVSEKMEHLYLKNGAVPIPSSIAKQIMWDKEFVDYDKDGYHYTRYIGGVLATKMMVGNFSGQAI